MVESARRSRRSFVAASAGVFATVGMVHAPAKAAEFEFKCGSDLQMEVPTNVRLTEMWKTIQRESGGRIHVQYFPQSQLGSITSMLSQVRLGAIQFQNLGPGALSAVVQASDITRVGFVFKDTQEGLRAMDGPLGDYVYKEILAKGLQPLRTVWDSSMRQIVGNPRPIRTPDDLHGYKIKVLGKLSVDLFKTLGSTTIELDFAELYTALQTKLIDGADLPLQAIEGGRLNEVGKYIALTNHCWGGYWTIVNADTWKRLPPDLQQIIERNNTKSAMLERRDTLVQTNALIDKLRRQGVTFNTPDTAPFRERLGPYFSALASYFGPTEWGMLQNSLGRNLV
jgi:TRAP-type transport system periplasmic protein